MNKPAPKEPSMDEILSSIRQIIADDDAAVAPKKPAPPVPPLQPTPVPRSFAPPSMQPNPDPEPAEPLTLTTEQMVKDEAEEPAAVLSFNDIIGTGVAPAKSGPLADAPQLVDPEDVAFEADDAAEEPAPVQPPVAPVFSASQPSPVPRFVPPPAPRLEPRPAPSVARAAPMPDPTLSRDMAEQLLAPATNAAVKANLSKLNGMSMPGSGVTVDGLIREMLRPMLKEWLDENLPSLVERMVEKEIARISRGDD